MYSHFACNTYHIGISLVVALHVPGHLLQLACLHTFAGNIQPASLLLAGARKHLRKFRASLSVFSRLRI